MLLNVILLIVALLNVILLNVILPSVISAQYRDTIFQKMFFNSTAHTIEKFTHIQKTRVEMLKLAYYNAGHNLQLLTVLLHLPFSMAAS